MAFDFEEESYKERFIFADLYNAVMSRPLVDQRSDVTSIFERRMFKYESPVLLFDIFAAKIYRNFQHQTTNHILVTLLENGQISFSNQIGDKMGTFDTGLAGQDVVSIAAPQMYDDTYFAIMTRDGMMKVFNYTLIEKSIVQSFGTRDGTKPKPEFYKHAL